ncbi:hypothetical protein [Corynebacterium epidermidicanis]|uniref:Asp23/Gls24 family envelope stress response protein n=1 Tax=Corynebacterium epidermidicanis TaxID=1050174 RepID=A0A0G3GM96_9CORY|nr:hypothetical protein [Corynebacterium epidermidicanis]AKK02264.1 hypothetical protein CEPID_01915 [Corynebacterium epidermidicanis]
MIDAATANRIADAVTRVPGVAAMYRGAYGELALLYPGTRVYGLKLIDGTLNIHIVASLRACRDTDVDKPALETLAEAAAIAATEVSGLDVRVVVSDIIE